MILSTILKRLLTTKVYTENLTRTILNIKFSNRTRDPVSALFEDDKLFFDETDQQPELYMAQGVENVEFDNFSRFEKSVKKF